MSDKKLAEALRALLQQVEYMGAPADHPDMVAACDALAAHDARSFAGEMYALADRAMATVRQQTGPALSLNQVSRLVELSKLAIAIGNDADEMPKGYQQ